MSCFLLIHTWMITYCMFQEIHHQILSLHQRHQFIFSDHVSFLQRPSHKQSEMKYSIYSFHIQFTVLSFVSVWNVLAPTGNRKKYHHELWCTYSKILIGVLKQWSCPNELISPHGGKANEKFKTIALVINKFMSRWLLILFNSE